MRSGSGFGGRLRREMERMFFFGAKKFVAIAECGACGAPCPGFSFVFGFEVEILPFREDSSVFFTERGHGVSFLWWGCGAFLGQNEILLARALSARLILFGEVFEKRGRASEKNICSY